MKKLLTSLLVGFLCCSNISIHAEEIMPETTDDTMLSTTSTEDNNTNENNEESENLEEDLSENSSEPILELEDESIINSEPVREETITVEDGWQEVELTHDDLVPAENVVEENIPDTIVTYPAVDLDGYTDDREIHVSVSAPEGVLPQGVSMHLVNMSEDASTVKAATDAIEADDTVTGQVVSVQAVDITFLSTSGEKIEPLLPISVTIRSDFIETVEDPVALLASQIVINSRVKSLAKLLTEGSLDILDGLDVEYISKSDNGGIKITVKEV